MRAQDMFKRVDEMEKAGMTDSLGPQVPPARRPSCCSAVGACLTETLTV